jgi:PiT family inorganic phosphate transporter
VSLALVLIVLTVSFLAYSNGANDNFKGVATLYGSGACGYQAALLWATGTTLAGSLLALLLAGELMETFKGKGLVADKVTGQSAFLLAVSLGAASTVLLATWGGLPVSTTHALTGGLLGAGLLAANGEVRLAALGQSFVAPLLFSPLAALALTVLFYPLFRRVRRNKIADFTMPMDKGQTALQSALLDRQSSIPLLDGLHYLSGGAVCFARALNDTPKIVALLLALEAAQRMDPQLGLVLVALLMAVGGVLNSQRVAATMSRKITHLSAGQGFTANLVTSLLVVGASRLGLPVSTTHVSVGALFGIGAVSGTAQLKTVWTILLAWVVTLPAGAAFAGGLYLFFRMLHV